tara:strand:- start:2 stop:691 length:690 start_codon:yes stop_codon:yes gene_type:complete
MKTKLIFLFSCVLFATSLLGCSKLDKCETDLKLAQIEIEKLNKKCDDCEKERTPVDKEKYALDLHIKFQIDCDNNSIGNVFHYDIKNGYQIIGTINSCKNGKLDAITFDIIEPGNCNRYKIDNAEWLELNSKKSNTTVITDDKETGKKLTHLLIFTINKKTAQDSDSSFILNKANLNFPSNNLTKTYIISNDTNIGYSTNEFPKGQLADSISTMVDRNSPICPTIIWSN